MAVQAKYSLPIGTFRPFYNVKPAAHGHRVHEKPLHRMMCELSLNGFSNVEIATQLKKNPMTVSNTLREPWCLQYMDEQARERANDLRERQAFEAEQAYIRVVDIAKNTLSDKIKLDANKTLIERGWGKVPDTINITNKDVKQMSNEELRSLLPSMKRQVGLDVENEEVSTEEQDIVSTTVSTSI